MPCLKIRRGTKSDLDTITLNLAELGYCTDMKSLYIGDGSSNVRLTSQSGRVNIPNGQDNISVVFDSAFDDTNYSIGLSLVNTVDNPPQIYSYIITNKLTTGFTVLFSSAMNTSNYVLEYIAH